MIYLISGIFLMILFLLGVIRVNVESSEKFWEMIGVILIIILIFSIPSLAIALISEGIRTL